MYSNIKVNWFFSLLFAGVIATIFPGKSYGQRVDVFPLTGGAQMNIPLYLIQRGDIQIPINLSYYGNGVKVKASEGNAGMNWNVSIGGSISRELRDLPDEIDQGTGADRRAGWLYNGNEAKIAAFTIANDNNKTTCPDETTDLTYLQTNFSSLWDMEPDVFHLNAPGLSATLVFRGNQLVSTDKSDLKVSYTLSGAGFGIQSIVVKTDQGLIYEFNVTERFVRQATRPNLSGILYQKRQYDLYKNTIGYNGNWYLSKITDNNGNDVSFGYSELGRIYMGRDVAFYIGDSNTKTKQYRIEDNYTPVLLTEVNYSGRPDNLGAQQLKISYKFNEYTRTYVISDLTLNSYESELIPIDPPASFWKIIWRLSFSYSEATANTSESRYRRYFLDQVIGSTHGKTINTKFDYYGLTKLSVLDYKIDLPDSASTQLDAWGYYNSSSASTLNPQVYLNPSSSAHDRIRTYLPSGLTSTYPYTLSGNTRSTDINRVKNGMLRSVTYENGGTSEITYEPQQFYDAQAGVDVIGGGVRVKQITDKDGLTTNDGIRTYDYTDPATGKSSGAPIALPQFAFMQSSTGGGTTEQQWKASIIRSDEDLSAEPDNILYATVKQSSPDLGSTLYRFSRPAMHFDVSSAPDWTPNWSYLARTGCATVGLVAADRNTYPFAPNMDFSFERGQLISETSYNQNGQKVKESTNTYVRRQTPDRMYALKMETIGNAVYYTKYPVLYNKDKVVQSRKEELFNIDGTVQESKVIDYTYGSTLHSYATQMTTTASDGSILRNNSKFLKDYNLTTATDATATAMKQLQDRGINIPIETWRTLERSGTVKTISAQLTRFNTFTWQGVTYQKPAQQLIFQNADGITDFQQSTVQGGNFSSDSRYWITTNYTAYGLNGKLLTSDDNLGNNQTILYTGHLPYVRAVGVAVRELSINTFEDLTTDYENGFKPDATVSTYSWNENDGRTGQRSLNLPTGTVFSRTVSKKAGTDRYLLSFWAKAPNAGNITLQLFVNGVSSQSIQVPFLASGSEWKFYQQYISVASISGDFVAKLQTSQNLAIDDIYFFPEQTAITVNTLDYDLGISTSQSTLNGVTEFYEYDGYGRLRRTLDADHNILVANSYVNKNDLIDSVLYIHHDGIASNKQINFSSYGLLRNKEGSKYIWNFGDGTAPVTTSSDDVQHMYTTNGNFVVTLQQVSALYGTYTASKPIVVTPYDSTASVEAHIGEMSGGEITEVKFYKGTNLYRSFSKNELWYNWNANISVPPGAYTVQVYTLGGYHPAYSPQGFKSVRCSYGSLELCRGVASGIYQFNVDLTTQPRIDFSVKLQDCELIEIE
ncbi:PKD domain-containing protein [Sphingobacterium sp. UBA5670]|uniref:PKD domain-containing protein n=1 Tax=Sphingobacterium sp. UBA5670 TaxID=1947502 RepID=UPI0025E0F8CE|nr:PKD domain-containing protein [Sphingobacterium sp. UBA5670]